MMLSLLCILRCSQRCAVESVGVQSRLLVCCCLRCGSSAGRRPIPLPQPAYTHSSPHEPAGSASARLLPIRLAAVAVVCGCSCMQRRRERHERYGGGRYGCIRGAANAAHALTLHRRQPDAASHRPATVMRCCGRSDRQYDARSSGQNRVAHRNPLIAASCGHSAQSQPQPRINRSRFMMAGPLSSVCNPSATRRPSGAVAASDELALFDLSFAFGP